MQCKKCEIDIPSQFEFALAQNVCPKCGNKLMPDAAMKVFIDLKTRLHEVEFVMDKSVVCERVAMFLITNYEVNSLSPGAKSTATKTPITTATQNAASDAAAVAKFKAELASIAEDMDSDIELTPEEIRAEEAARAEDLVAAREMGIDPDLADGEEMVSGRVDNDRVQRLKKLAMATKGEIGAIKRRTSQ
jgi:hypothetical protein